MKKVFIAVIIILFLAGLVVGGYLLYKKYKENSKTKKSTNEISATKDNTLEGAIKRGQELSKAFADEIHQTITSKAPDKLTPLNTSYGTITGTSSRTENIQKMPTKGL